MVGEGMERLLLEHQLPVLKTPAAVAVDHQPKEAERQDREGQEW
jgi:hypothetical protein